MSRTGADGQVLEDVVEGHVDCIVYRPVGFVGGRWDSTKRSKDFVTTEFKTTGL